MGGYRQNLEAKGLGGKILGNKELAFTCSGGAVLDWSV